MQPSRGTALGWGCVLGWGETCKHQLGCESWPTVVASLGRRCLQAAEHPMAPALMDLRLVQLSLRTALPPQKHCFPLHTLPAGFCSLPDMCFVLAPPKVKNWLESMLSNSEGAFHFLVRSGSFKLLSLSHFKDGNRRKHLLLCLENIINVFWLHKPALTEDVQTQRVQGG